jgi:hypothetical protein
MTAVNILLDRNRLSAVITPQSAPLRTRNGMVRQMTYSDISVSRRRSGGTLRT